MTDVIISTDELSSLISAALIEASEALGRVNGDWERAYWQGFAKALQIVREHSDE